MGLCTRPAIPMDTSRLVRYLRNALNHPTLFLEFVELWGGVIEIKEMEDMANLEIRALLCFC